MAGFKNYQLWQDNRTMAGLQTYGRITELWQDYRTVAGFSRNMAGLQNNNRITELKQDCRTKGGLQNYSMTELQSYATK